MLEISDHTVRNIVSTGAPYITETLIPEKYRLYEGNKKGVVSSPFFLLTLVKENCILHDCIIRLT